MFCDFLYYNFRDFFLVSAGKKKKNHEMLWRFYLLATEAKLPLTFPR